MLGIAVPLGGQQATPVSTRDAAFYKEDIGFLPGFENTTFGVNRGQFGHQPLWIGLRTALSCVPCRPSIALGGNVDVIRIGQAATSATPRLPGVLTVDTVVMGRLGTLDASSAEKVVEVIRPL